MAKGSIYPSEKNTIVDQETGVTITRLTSALCHSNHLYFTHWPYYDSCRRMIFHSDRGGAQNVFAIDFETGEIRQLTGFEPGSKGAGPFSACVSRVKDEAYFWSGRILHALDLWNLGERPIWRGPEKGNLGSPNCSADGRFVYFTINEDLTDRLAMDLLRGQVGFNEYWQARPRCGIVRVPVEGGEGEMLWEEDNWIGHVNCSPTVPSILSFCHEGPWEQVDHRMWCLDADEKRAWKIRPEPDRAVIGHEYWFEDGTRVGYHGRAREGGPFWGHADYMSDDHVEYPVPRGSMHFQSLDAELIVGDGGRDDPYIILWKREGENREGEAPAEPHAAAEPHYDSRLLCKHRGSFHIQRLHVHPAITPGGKSVIFTSDLGDYGQIHQVAVPDLATLPPA